MNVLEALQAFYTANSAIIWLSALVVTFVVGVWVPGVWYRQAKTDNIELLRLLRQGSDIRGALMHEVKYRPQASGPVPPYDKDYMKEVLRRLVVLFSEDELKSLAFDMDIEYENLSGEGKAGKALEFVKLIQRQGRGLEFISKILVARPNFFATVEELQ